MVDRVDMLLRQYRRACRHTANQRQGQLGKRLERALAGLLHRLAQADAARGAADQFDHALAGQRLQVFFRRIGGAEAQFCGDFGTCGRSARLGDGLLDEFQDLLLACGEFDGRVHDLHCRNRRKRELVVHPYCLRIQ